MKILIKPMVRIDAAVMQLFAPPVHRYMRRTGYTGARLQRYLVISAHVMHVTVLSLSGEWFWVAFFAGVLVAWLPVFLYAQEEISYRTQAEYERELTLWALRHLTTMAIAFRVLLVLLVTVHGALVASGPSFSFSDASAVIFNLLILAGVYVNAIPPIPPADEELESENLSEVSAFPV